MAFSSKQQPVVALKMQRERKLRQILWRWLTSISYRGLICLFGVVLLCKSVMATSRSTGLQIAQQSTNIEQNAIRVAAQKAFDEGFTLFQEGTAESLKQAIVKWEEALKLWVKVGDKSQQALTLLFIGKVNDNLGEKIIALEYYNQALTIYHATVDRTGEGRTLNNIGKVYDDLGEKQKALEYYNQAIPLLRRVGDRGGEARTLNNMGGVYDDLGEKQKALEYYNQALLIYRAVGNKRGEVATLNNMGGVYDDLGEKQKALKYYNQALPIYRAVGDKRGEAATLNNIGKVYDDLGEKQKALQFYNQALPLLRAVGDRGGEASVLNNIGLANDDLGEKQKALQFLNQALPIYRAVGDKRGEARTLNNIGGVYDALGEKQKALQFYNQALPLRRAVGDKGGEGTTLNNIGAVYNDLGEKQKALQFLNQALPIHRAVGDRGGEATNLNNIGQIYDDLGEKQEALQFYNQALPIYRAVGDRGGEATTANNIARVYNDLGEKQKALQFLNQALPLFRAIGDRGGEATNLNNIGAIYNDLREKQKALRFYNQALPIYRAVGDRDGEATTLNNIGAVYNDLGEKQKALQFLDQALPIYHAVGDRGGEASVLNNIGLTYYDLREKQKALQFLNQALPLRRAVGDRGGEAAILGNIALLEMNQGNLQEALNKVEDAIKIIEDLRTKVVSPELRTSYFATKQGYYQFKINLLMHLHKQNLSKGYDAQALETSDRARARSLVELLTEANANIREGIKPELLERERNLQQKLNALEKQKLELASRPNTEKKIADIKQQIDKLLDDYQQLRTEIRLNSRRYADLKFPESLTLKEIQQKILDDDTLLLTYSLGEERSYLWLVSKTEIHSYELPKRAEIEAQAKQFHGYLKANPNKFTSQAATDIGKQSATKLSQMLLQPVAKKLSNKRLLIVSDGALQYVPFTALPVCQDATCNVSTPLLANHEIINSPSVSTIAILRSEQQQHKLAPKTLAVLADPVFSKDDTRLSCQGKQDTSPAKINPKNQSENLDSLLLERSARESDVNFRSLPFTCQEAEGIFLEPKSSIKALRFDANRAFAMNPQLSQYRYIHFATHGILNSTNPQLSGVVLSLVNQKGETENGFLRLNDIFNLKLPAELVVLSACETALGKEVRGEGLVGLTRGFMYAGSPRLVVSLWKVQDEGTSVLMKKFYTKMLLQGLKPAEALRAAQLEMSQDKKYFAPYYWAGFTLQGEWK